MGSNKITKDYGNLIVKWQWILIIYLMETMGSLHNHSILYGMLKQNQERCWNYVTWLSDLGLKLFIRFVWILDNFIFFLCASTTSPYVASHL